MPFERVTDLTEKQAEVWMFLVNYVEANGYQPSQVEIAEHFGVTKKAIADRLVQLHAKGYIELPERYKDRCIKIMYVKFHAEFLSETP